MSSLEIITTAVLLLIFVVLIIVTYRKFRNGYFSVAMPVAMVLFIFFCIPIILDVTVGKPDYSSYKGFYRAINNGEVSNYYNIYLSFVGLVFIRYIMKNKERQISLNTIVFSQKIYKYRYALWFLMFLPFVAVLFSNDPTAYLEYKAVLNNRTESFKNSHLYVGKATIIAAMAASILFYYLKKFGTLPNIIKYALFIFLLLLTLWVDGKRGIIAKFFFNLLISGWLLGMVKPKKLVRKGLISLIILISFVMLYGKDFDSSNNYSRDVYSSFRLNLGRDHTVKYTLYKEYILGEKILEYRGQSFFHDLVFFVPRQFWPEKPYPYAVYYVTSVLEYPPEPIGWSFTTSIIEEMISNFGFWGMLLAPLFLLYLCRIGDRTSNSVLKMFSIVVAVFFVFTQLPAFMPVFLIFIILHFKDKKSKVKTMKPLPLPL